MMQKFYSTVINEKTYSFIYIVSWFSIGEKNIFFQLTKNIDIFVSPKDGECSLYIGTEQYAEIEKRQFRILFDSDK